MPLVGFAVARGVPAAVPGAVPWALAALPSHTPRAWPGGEPRPLLLVSLAPRHHPASGLGAPGQSAGAILHQLQRIKTSGPFPRGSRAELALGRIEFDMEIMLLPFALDSASSALEIPRARRKSSRGSRKGPEQTQPAPTRLLLSSFLPSLELLWWSTDPVAPCRTPWQPTAPC